MEKKESLVKRITLDQERVDVLDLTGNSYKDLVLVKESVFEELISYLDKVPFASIRDKVVRDVEKTEDMVQMVEVLEYHADFNRVINIARERYEFKQQGIESEISAMEVSSNLEQ